MSTFRLATDAEQAELEKAGPASVDLTVYKAGIGQLVVARGDAQYSKWSRIDLAPGESRKLVLRRFTQAARAMGLHVANRRHATDPTIVWLRLRPAPVKKGATTPSANGPVVEVPPTPAAAPAPAGRRQAARTA